MCGCRAPKICGMVLPSTVAALVKRLGALIWVIVLPLLWCHVQKVKKKMNISHSMVVEKRLIQYKHVMIQPMCTAEITTLIMTRLFLEKTRIRNFT